jgi:hypothetical protein
VVIEDGKITTIQARAETKAADGTTLSPLHVGSNSSVFNNDALHVAFMYQAFNLVNEIPPQNLPWLR